MHSTAYYLEPNDLSILSIVLLVFKGYNNELSFKKSEVFPPTMLIVISRL